MWRKHSDEKIIHNISTFIIWGEKNLKSSLQDRIQSRIRFHIFLSGSTSKSNGSETLLKRLPLNFKIKSWHFCENSDSKYLFQIKLERTGWEHLKLNLKSIFSFPLLINGYVSHQVLIYLFILDNLYNFIILW